MDKNLIFHFSHNVDFRDRIAKRKKESSDVTVIAIDPGTVNMGFRIERRKKTGKVETLFMEKVKIKSFKTAKIGNKSFKIENLHQNMISYFEEFEDYYKDVDLVVIEKQLIQAPMNRIVENMIIMYFSVILKDSPRLPSIVTINAAMKYKILNIEGLKGKGPNSKKQNGIVYSVNLLKKRGDERGLKMIQKYKKMDDVSDTIILCESYFKYLKKQNK